MWLKKKFQKMGNNCIEKRKSSAPFYVRACLSWVFCLDIVQSKNISYIVSLQILSFLYIKATGWLYNVKKWQYEKMKYMGQVKYLSNESQKQSRCVRIAFFYWKYLTTVFQVGWWKCISSKNYIFLCVITRV